MNLESINKARKVSRKAQELLYEHTCDVIEHKQVKKPNGSTGFDDVTVLEKQPCLVGFTTSTVQTSETTTEEKQSITLYISPDVTICPGSKIIANVRGTVTAYKNSGQPAIYATHQEIALELFRSWS